MRKKGIIILIVIIAIFAVIVYFAQDRYLERGLEKALQAIAGAKVEINNFHFSLLKAECSWNRIQIANKNDPWRNILETGRASFDLETRPLFWRRVIIKEMVVEDVRSGTQRKSDGSLPKKVEPPSKPGEPGIAEKAKKALEKQLGEIPIFDLSGLGKKLKIDSLVNVENLATVQAYDNLKISADSTFDYWKSQLDLHTYTARVNDLEKKIKALNLDKIDDIKDVVALAELIKKVDDIYKEVNSLKKDVEGKYDALTQTFNDLENELKLAQNMLQADINRAQQLAKLKDLDVKDVSMLLFGSAVVQRTEQLLDYVALARKYLPTAKKLQSPKKEKPPRLKGQDIYFPFKYRYPRFLLRHAKLSAATAAGDTSRAFFLDGDLKGFTNQPNIYGKSTRFNISSKKVSSNQYEIRGSLDHVTEEARDSLWVSAKNFAMGKISLGESKYFPKSVNAEKGDVSLAGFFIGDGIDLKLNLDTSPVQFIFEKEAQDKVAQIVREVLSGLNYLNLKTQMKGAGGDYKLNMSSNVDQLLANQVKKTLEKNLREAQQQVENYVRAEVDKRREEVETFIDKNKQTAYSELEKLNQKVQQQLDEVNKYKKQLEDKKKELEDQAKKKIMDIFKKPGD